MSNNGNRILQIDEDFKKNAPKIATPEVKCVRVYLPHDNSHVVAKASDVSTVALPVPFNVMGQQGYTPMFVTVIKNAWMQEKGEWRPVEGQLDVMNGCVIIQPVQTPTWMK